MELLKVKIGSHKVLRDISIDFANDDGSSKSIILIAGINGSGKTSLLEYIGRKIKDYKFDASGNLDLLTEFDKSEEGDKYLSSIKTIRIDQSLLSSLKSDLPAKDYLIAFDANGQLINIPKDKETLFADTIANLSTKVFYLQTEKFRYKSPDEVVYNYVNNIIFTKNVTPDIAYREVQFILEDLFEDFDLRVEFGGINFSRNSDKDYGVYFKNKYSEKIKINDLSTGEKELITKAFYLEMLQPREAIILVDEPERSLHPLWQKKIVAVYRRLASKYGCQFIVATHSPHIISSVPPEDIFILGEFGENAKIIIRNLGDLNRQTQGLEPNRILKEIMGVATLRDDSVIPLMNKITELLNEEDFDSEETQNTIQLLSAKVGEADPFMVRVRHQLKVLERRKIRA